MSSVSRSAVLEGPCCLRPRRATHFIVIRIPQFMLPPYHAVPDAVVAAFLPFISPSHTPEGKARIIFRLRQGVSHARISKKQNVHTYVPRMYLALIILRLNKIEVCNYKTLTLSSAICSVRNIHVPAAAAAPKTAHPPSPSSPNAQRSGPR